MAKKKRHATVERKSAIVRASFVKVLGDTKDFNKTEDGRVKYTMMCLIPKSVDSIGVNLTDDRKKQLLKEGKAFYKALKADAVEVAERAFPDDDPADYADAVLKDGDKINTKKRKKDAKPLAPGYFYFNVSTMSQPSVMRPKAADGAITDSDADELFSGCWVRIFYNVYSYDHPENSGVSIGLGNIKKCYEDERLGGGTGAKFDDEDDVEELEPDDKDFDDAPEGKAEEDDEDWD